MANNNTNTNVVQINFPKDMEIRKIKKKTKPKSNRKKKALEEVKAALQAYDQAVAEAQDKKIPIPQELIEMPQDIKEIDTIKELEELAFDLENKTRSILALIQQGGRQQRVGGLFQEPSALAQPVIPSPQQAIFQPPPRVFEQPIPQRPVQVIDSSQPQPVDPNAQKTLDEIKQEILDKLTPEQRAKAEQEMKQEGQQPDVPQQPVQPSGEPRLETNKGVLVGNNRIDLTAPVGFYNIFRSYQRLIENLQANATLLSAGVYRIPQEKFDEMETERKQLFDEYRQFLLSMDDATATYYSRNLSQLDAELNTNLQLTSPRLLEKILKSQGKDVREVTAGEEASSLAGTTETQKTKDFENLVTSFTKDVDLEMSQFVKEPDKDKERAAERTTIYLNDLKVKLNRAFGNLDGKEKVSIFDTYNKLKAKIDRAIQQVNMAAEKAKPKPSPVTPQPQPQPEPPEEAEPSSPIVTPVKKGRKRLPKTPEEIFLVNYIRENKEDEYTSEERQALERLIDSNPQLREDRTKLIRQIETGNKIANLREFLSKTIGIKID
jgi:hypothetical protein